MERYLQVISSARRAQKLPRVVSGLAQDGKKGVEIRVIRSGFCR
jgi:hypothetical protein